MPHYTEIRWGFHFKDTDGYGLYDAFYADDRDKSYMSKQVISFRLSESEVQVLDEACHRFNENRSQVITRAIKALLAEYVERDGKLIRQRYWMPNLDGKYNPP